MIDKRDQQRLRTGSLCAPRKQLAKGDSGGEI
jgi:hypothetical protein